MTWRIQLSHRDGLGLDSLDALLLPTMDDDTSNKYSVVCLFAASSDSLK